jgi:hypothetical protein
MLSRRKCPRSGRVYAFVATRENTEISPHLEDNTVDRQHNRHRVPRARPFAGIGPREKFTSAARHSSARTSQNAPPDLPRQSRALHRILLLSGGTICCDQSTIAMWLVAWQAASKLALPSRKSTAGRTTDGEYLFAAEFFLHSLRRRFGGPRPCKGCLRARFHFL